MIVAECFKCKRKDVFSEGVPCNLGCQSCGGILRVLSISPDIKFSDELIISARCSVCHTPFIFPKDVPIRVCHDVPNCKSFTFTLSILSGLNGQKILKHYEPKKLEICWIHDLADAGGGAEISNDFLIAYGKKVGVNVSVYQILKQDVSMLKNAHLVVVSSVNSFSDSELATILAYVNQKPFVKYSHDYRDLESIKRYSFFYSQAQALFFISPKHVQEFSRVYGKYIEEKAVVLPLAFDSSIFIPGKGNGNRQSGRVIVVQNENKGYGNILRFADNHPDREIQVFTDSPHKLQELAVNRRLSNIFANKQIPLFDLVNEYRKSEYVLSCPSDLKCPGERPLIEGVLCGCKPIFNEEAGHGSWPLSDNDFPALVKSAPNKFWGTIKKVVKENTALFFVFTGEWGYEILSAHGWLRTFRHLDPNVTIGVVSRAGAEILYKDFCDIYIDATDIFANYTSSMFGNPLDPDDRHEIEKRCFNHFSGSIKFVYSNETTRLAECIWWGNPGENTPYWNIRSTDKLLMQNWVKPDLKKYKKQRAIINKVFPDLLSGQKYVLLQDRIRTAAWGKENISKEIWFEIIDRLIAAGNKVVLIGYKPYKLDDSFSIFYSKDFIDRYDKNPMVVNVTRLLTSRITENLIYQALLFENALYWLGVWGSSSMFPCLFGVSTFAITLGRAENALIQRDTDAWNVLFKKFNAQLTPIFTTHERDSIINGLVEYCILPERNISHEFFDNDRISVLNRPECLPKKTIQEVQDKFAVVTLCWNRLFYTKYSFHTLYQNAGMLFDHIIVDNGSNDGTEKWLQFNSDRFTHVFFNEKNIGLFNSFKQVIVYLEEHGYKWFIATANDIEVLTENFISSMVEFWSGTKGHYTFAPIIHGINEKIKVYDEKRIKGFQVQFVGPIGGVYQSYPVKEFKEILFKMSMWRANEMCKELGNLGIQTLYLKDLEVNHFETSNGQFKRYPNYPGRKNGIPGYIR